jgi:beta,beta-carotene 9',10'-dioxygenase
MKTVVESRAADTRARWSRQGGFTSLDEEIQVDRLPITGALPDWLEGTLVRLTPALWEIGAKTTRHWFDGLAMLNAFAIRGGEVSYASRFLESESYQKARQGSTAYVGIANDPCRAFFKRVSALFQPTINDNCNVNIARLGERFLAMTELPVPMEFDPKTLETRGLVKWNDKLGGHLYSAHPHYDHERDELLSYLGHLGPRSEYRVYAVPAGSTARRPIARIPTRQFSYIHSFGMTERYLVLAEFPLLFNPLQMLNPRQRPLAHMLKWKPERPTRFFIVDRRDGGLARTFETEGFFAFHHINAYELGDELLVDLIVNEDGPSWIRMFEMDHLRGDGSIASWLPRPWRYRLSLRDGKVARECLSDVRLDLPRINYRSRNTRPYRCFYGASFATPDSQWFDQLSKLEINDGKALHWSEPGCYVGEPVFAARPGSEREDDGVILSVVFDSIEQRSFLLVLEAGTFAEIARAEAPHVIPFGFHGDYVPESE